MPRPACVSASRRSSIRSIAARRGRGRRRARRALRPRSMPHPKDCRCWCSISAPIGGQAGASARIENYLGFPTGISGAGAGRARVQPGAEVRRRGRHPARGEVSRLRRAGAAAARSAAARTDRRPQRYGRAPWWSRRARATASRTFRMSPTSRARACLIGRRPVEAKLCEGEEIALIGGGNSAGQAVVFLAPKVKHLHLVVRRQGLKRRCRAI